jgi:2-amino-4-hydroxy-6-hydroxymethyldihydropteridine diphosphokinase
MILIALGANLPSFLGGPIETLEAALIELDTHPAVSVIRRSHWYASSPVGRTDQPDFVNGVAIIEADLQPGDLLDLLLALEVRFGRERDERWGPRLLDLDIVDFDGLCETILQGENHLHLPHPRAHERAFVLAPIEEIAPEWLHPILGRYAADLLSEIDSSQKTTKIALK